MLFYAIYHLLMDFGVGPYYPFAGQYIPITVMSPDPAKLAVGNETYVRV